VVPCVAVGGFDRHLVHLPPSVVAVELFVILV
jgi:hypothetical protein